MNIQHFFKLASIHVGILKKIRDVLPEDISSFQFEECYNVEVNGLLSENDCAKLVQLLSSHTSKVRNKSISDESKFDLTIEVGPRLNFCTPYSTNVLCILSHIGLEKVTRFEMSKIYHFKSKNGDSLSRFGSKLEDLLHDRMTETVYTSRIDSFNLPPRCDSVFSVDLLGEGLPALKRISAEMGLGMDEWDLQFYTKMFVEQFKRNPTNIECFDLAQSNSEHSRHWFFKGDMEFDDGTPLKDTLFEMIVETQKHSQSNNVIAFSDNSSAIKGYEVPVLVQTEPSTASPYKQESSMQHICLTAETHNFPTGVAPFPGAATGTGGRIRDVQAVGRGGLVVAGLAGYCVGNLHLPGYELIWELPSDTTSSKAVQYPCNMASAQQVITEASNGASDYGNKFGEPVIAGFFRSFGAATGDGVWREWIKPIMFSGGIGQVRAEHVHKQSATVQQAVVKVGGPVYRIGVGGGAASSLQVQGAAGDAERDFGAVQRGDPQMGNKLNRAVRACAELGSANPLAAIHDQGAGGNGNVLKELVEPLGADIHAAAFQLGDETISLLELWGAEYQESNGLLVEQKNLGHLQQICTRERCPMSVVGHVTGSGHVHLLDWDQLRSVVDLDLGVVLGHMPRKRYILKRSEKVMLPLTLPPTLQVAEALTRVLRLPSIACKRFLTNKVDRSVSGLVAQQQCVGPLHTPLADAAVVALCHNDVCGAVTAIGEQPVKGMLDAARGARLSLVESLTNLVAVGGVSQSLDCVKVSGNWMWPAKLPGEGAQLREACEALCGLLCQLGVAIDGGKDSLGMAAVARNSAGESVVVKAPGAIVVSAYVGCADVGRLTTPDLKPVDSVLIWIRLGGQSRLGGSALAQVFGQLGDECPDLDDVNLFKRSWVTVKALLDDRLILACHDVSDGGLITSLLEMAFAGNVGVQCNLKSGVDTMSLLFAEEPGWVVQVASDNWYSSVEGCLGRAGLTYVLLGSTTISASPRVNISVNGVFFLNDVKLCELRWMWEETGYELEKQQCVASCVKQEYLLGLRDDPVAMITATQYHCGAPLLSVTLPMPEIPLSGPVRLAVVREEGSNGDREMTAAFFRTGFECWDVTMQDLIDGNITLDRFTGLAFVGGFSYGDVLGAGKGWAASILYREALAAQFRAFRDKSSTFSLGVCNGCQLMAHLGWISDEEGRDRHVGQLSSKVRLEENESGRFESRFCSVTIPTETCSVMLAPLRGSCLGVWVSHGEGRFVTEPESLLEQLTCGGQLAMRYEVGACTSQSPSTPLYPLNPNGSRGNVAGLVSRDGRHLALMPHPERTVRWWNWAHVGGDLAGNHGAGLSPWQHMFCAAYDWATRQEH